MKIYCELSKNFLKILNPRLLRRIHLKSQNTLDLSNLLKNSNDSNDRLPSVVIVGAGMAGITAAETLLRNGITNIRILEATERYGGRIYSKKWNDAICELGAKCVNFPFDETIYQVYGDIGVDSNSTVDYRFFKSDGNLVDPKISKSVRKEFSNLKTSIADLMLLTSSSTNNIDMIIQNVEKRCPSANKDDIASVINAVLNTLRARFGTDLQNVNFNLCEHKIVSTKKINLPFGCLSFFNLLTVPEIKKFISFDSPVGSIKRMYQYQRRFVRTSTLNGKTFDSDYVISTIPLGTLTAIGSSIFDPPLPKDRLNSMKNIGIGNVERIFLMFQEPIANWFQGPVNFAWYPKELTNRNHWATGVATVNKLAGANKILEITIAGFQAEDICLVSEDKAMTDVHSTLKKFLGNSQIPYPVDILRSSWSKDICSLGSIVYPKQNATIDDLMNQEETADFDITDHPRLLFAGDATITEHFGTIHGARLSGIREAKRIVESVTNNTFNRNIIKRF